MIKEDLINPRDVNTEQKAVNFTEIASVSDRDDETRGIFSEQGDISHALIINL